MCFWADSIPQLNTMAAEQTTNKPQPQQQKGAADWATRLGMFASKSTHVHGDVQLAICL